MSGICGICRPGARIEAADIRQMLEASAVSGETGLDSALSNAAAVGVSQRWDHQQRGSAPGVQIVVDADLLNLPALQEEVGLDRAHSAAATMAMLYAKHGESFVEKLDGTFSFILWDEHEQKLVAAVDRMGVRGLNWRQERHQFLIATRLSAIGALQDAPPEVDDAALMQFLIFSVIPAPLSIYKDTRKLDPGYMAVYQRGELRLRRYWDLNYAESNDRNVDAWAGKVREALRSAVHRNLTGLDGERTGAYLSGGTDSSSVVAFMNERHSPVKAFSISFSDNRYDEGDFARTTAQQFGAHHYERSLSPEDAAAAIPKVLRYYEEPFANSSAIGAYWCARVAQEAGVSTLLAGDGGDELFAGNSRYADDKPFAMYQRIPRFLRQVIEPVANALPDKPGFLSLPKRYVRRANIPLPKRMFSYDFFLSTPPAGIFNPEFLRGVPPESWFAIADSHFHNCQASSDLNRLLYFDVKLILGDNDIRKVRGTAELAGMQVRFPLLDWQLAEFAARIPSSLKLKGSELRFIFKQAMRGILTDKVLFKKKHGFGVPLGTWFLRNRRLSNMADEVLFDRRTLQRGYFRPEFIENLRRTHRSGDAPYYYGETLWYLMVLEMWHREHFELRRAVPAAR